MRNIRILVLLVLAVAVTFAGLSCAQSAPAPSPAPSPSPSPTPSPTPSLTPSPSPPPPSGTGVTVDLSAQNVRFDKDTITVPAGAMVTIRFNNMESIPHNFALYETPAASKDIFVGEVISGPRIIEYRFQAPETPETYFFRCDVHPVTMVGDFVVTAP